MTAGQSLRRPSILASLLNPFASFPPNPFTFIDIGNSRLTFKISGTLKIHGQSTKSGR